MIKSENNANLNPIFQIVSILNQGKRQEFCTNHSLK